MKRLSVWIVGLLAWVLVAQAQVPTSRQIPFNNVPTTIAPGTTGQTLTFQLWDAATGGNQLYCENQTLDVDTNAAITFNFGAGTVPALPCASAPPGLDPNNFPSGASRFLDVVDSTGASVLPAPPGRIALNAVAFALSPGPQGPQGVPGPQGSPGVVQAVSRGDASIVVGGTAANPTVAVAANGITNANVANGALSPGKIAGIAATLGPNIFAGNQLVNGSVGIGTSSPQQQLDVFGVIRTSGPFPNFNGITNANLVSEGNNTGNVAFWTTTGGVTQPRMTIVNNGNVGIGTIAPSSLLHVVGSQPAVVAGNGTNATPALQITGGKGGNTGGGPGFIAGTGAGVSLTGAAGGDNAGEGIECFIFFNCPGGSGGSITLQPGAGGSGNPFGPSGAVLLAPSGGLVGIGLQSPAFKLHVIDSANSGLRVQTNTSSGTVASFGGFGDFQVDFPGVVGGRLIIKENANVGIGVQSPMFRLDLPNVAGPGGQGRANAWVTYSSIRWKENIRPIDHALEKVERLRGVYYDGKLDKKNSLGVIAEEVGKVVPEVVTYENNGVDAQAVDYARLTALLIEAVKEQQAEIRELKRELGRLTAR